MEKLKQKFTSLKIDGILCPTYVTTAYNVANVDDMSGLYDYTIVWNTFDLPAGVVPVTIA